MSASHNIRFVGPRNSPEQDCAHQRARKADQINKHADERTAWHDSPRHGDSLQVGNMRRKTRHPADLWERRENPARLRRRLQWLHGHFAREVYRQLLPFRRISGHRRDPATIQIGVWSAKNLVASALGAGRPTYCARRQEASVSHFAKLDSKRA